MAPAPNPAAWTAAAEALPAVAGALALDLSHPSAGGCSFLFVVLSSGHSLNNSLWSDIHRCAVGVCGITPDAIYAVPELPRAADGRLLSRAARRIMTGEPAARVVADERVANPASLERFVFLFNNL